MGILEIISAICLILACIFIIIMVLMQDSKRGMSQALTGGNSDNFYQKNQGRSKEQQLVRATRTAAILFFIVTLVANVFAIYFRGDDAPPIGEDGLPHFYADDIGWDMDIHELFGDDIFTDIFEPDNSEVEPE
jgi:preprotein translocase subunit SecG